jgi:hypothetical protein
MGKGVITVDQEEIVVREDTWKAHRGVKWAFISLLAFIAIAAVLFVSGLLTASTDGNIESPAGASNTQTNK